MAKIVDLTGKRFGKLVAVENLGTDKFGKTKYRCRCDCGKEKVFFRWQLTSGKTLSCGCLYKHGFVGSRIYNIWGNMKQRCSNPKNTAYSYYGGRGIKVCEEWKSNPRPFIKWALENGYSDDLTLDRIDTNGDYSPENCRWETMKEQVSNRRCGKFLTFGGETHNYADWARLLNIPPNTICERAKKGLPVEQILSTEPLKGKQNKKENCL